MTNLYPTVKTYDVKIKYKHPDSYRLIGIGGGDWIDLAVDEDVALKQFEFRLLSLGVAMQLPEGYEAHIIPRSSTFIKHGILQTNSFGLIDNSYKGDEDWWKFPALAMKDTVVPRGTRICQFKIVPTQKSYMNFYFYEVFDFGTESRGGFGSTGN